MKNVADERIRSNMSNGPLFTGMSLLPGIKPPIPPLLAASRGKFITLGDQDLQEHPAFETIRAIARLVEIHAPGTVVSARDVDLRRFLHALTGVHAVSLTQDCLVLQRWHAYLAEGTPSQSLFHPLTEAQARRNEERARDVPYKNTPNTEAQEAAWETALRDEVEQHHARNPKIQRRYTDKEWISGSGLSKNVRDLAFMAGSSSSTTTAPVSQPPEGFMTSLGGPSKRAVLMVMEGALEEECKSMGRLHALVGQYLERRFAPLRMRERAGTEEV
ncbi:hypothetical protein M408DRAFT_205941 [Serendipita vermifera MAFF 305830]|uniref:Uncharacterized protein n=1 Tax=Serendipita vermifera MAFF 305830 TaxID=933852 RepID=A0A0C3AM71_SERVB|nr:hypothetical protein M408DRAFT_205941 [Serendipita vermifera MAFF 305830]